MDTSVVPRSHSVSALAAVLGPDRALPVVNGSVVERSSGLPLGGVVVRWVVHAPGPPRGDQRHTMTLAEGSTVADGSFALVAAESPAVRRALCALAADPAAPLMFEVGPGHLAVAVDHLEAGAGLVIALPGGETPDPGHWAALGAFLAANRLVRADDLQGQLSAPTPDSPVRTWSVGDRAAALAAMSGALGLQDGVAPTQLLDLGALTAGDVGKAVTRFRDFATFERFGGTVDEWTDGGWFRQPTSDLELYRDYLRGVWVGAARQMHAETDKAVASDAAFEVQLDTRLLQRFRTADAAMVPAHGLLVTILERLLTTAVSAGGFGLALPARPAGQTDPDRVAVLVQRSGQSASELRNRVRVRFDRPEDALASAIGLNVEALLGLLADTWQSPEEPFVTPLRGVAAGTPLLVPPFLGRAPYFLQFEEWLDRQRRFYPENVYDIRRTVPIFTERYRKVTAGQKSLTTHTRFNPNNAYFTDPADWAASAGWLERMFGIVDEIRAALASAEQQSFGQAHGHLDAALRGLADARTASKAAWVHDDFVWFRENGGLPPPADLKRERRVSLKRRATLPVTNRGELAAFEAFFDAQAEPGVGFNQGGPQPGDFDYEERWLARARTVHSNQLDHLELVVVPYLRATLLDATGDKAGAVKVLSRLTGYEVGVAEMTDGAGWFDSGGFFKPPYFYQGQSAPYTTAVAFDEGRHDYDDQVPLSGFWPGSRSSAAPPVMAPFEHRFLKQAQAQAMLGWADELYRADDPASIRRARELYKGVCFLHGEDPGIAPHYPVPGEVVLPRLGGFPGIGGLVVTSQANPVRMAQLAQARAGFGMIELGLNAYGFHADMVPVLRYRPLKAAADQFAASAKAAQADFLQYQTRFEQGLIEGWQAAAMVQKAQAGVGIAAEQIGIAQAGVARAQEQVAAVQAQIAAKKKEIADKSSLFSQAEDFFGGMKDSLSSLASAGKGVMTEDAAASSVSSEELVAMLGKSSGGGAAAKEAAVATLGSGAALTLGFGAFAYYGYVSMSGMADAANKRDAELKGLETGALAAAQAQVTLKQRDVTIARLMQQIAATELDLARAIDRFQRERFLNVDVWNKLAAFAQRTMRRFLELGARAAWFAERALAFEANRPLAIVKLNYAPTALRGLTGADRLLADLAELEATRLNGIRLSVPVKHTLSLARDLPLAFGQLKKTGRCTFHTAELPLQLAYPGTFGYRIRAVTVAAHDPDGPAPRGVLQNLGVSTVSRDDGGGPTRLVRFADGLPLSEFRLHDDMWVYGLPGETLLQFEGSGIETDWELAFPAEANPKGLRTMADVLVTFDLNAGYSRLAPIVAAPAEPGMRAIALAASVWDRKGLATLRGPGPVSVTFDLARLALPKGEGARTVANMALMAVGPTAQDVAATLEAKSSGVTSSFSVAKGLALSNSGPLLGAAAALPLNAMVGEVVDQAFVLSLDRLGVETQLARLQDLVLWVEYAVAP